MSLVAVTQQLWSLVRDFRICVFVSIVGTTYVRRTVLVAYPYCTIIVEFPFVLLPGMARTVYFPVYS